MKLVIVADEKGKEELLSGNVQEDAEIFWLNHISEIKNHPDADAVIDLLFTNESSGISLLTAFLPKPVIINSVMLPVSELNQDFVRINGWPGFLKREIIECSSLNEESRNSCEKIFSVFGKKATWVPDIAGFITPRIIALIINEAFLAHDEKVSTKEDIDIAMKLGTNYPYGPFEWADKIGQKNILNLLNKLSEKNIRYKAATLLIKEATEKK